MQPQKKYFNPGNDLSYAKLAEIYDDLYNNRFEKNCDLVLPQHSKFSSFGNKMAFCQIINTWFRANPKSNVRIYDNHFEIAEHTLLETVKKFVTNAELFSLLALIYGLKTKIMGYTHKQMDYTKYFEEPLKQQLIFSYRELTSVSVEDAFPNEYFQIHPDFLGDDFFISNYPFYLKLGPIFSLQREDRINALSKKLFNRLTSLNVAVSKQWIKKLQTFFYETFDNSFYWGRYDWLEKTDNKLLDRSNRIFAISSKNIVIKNEQDKKVSANIDLRLLDFFKRHNEISGRGAESKFLELSVLDNGIGIVNTFKGVQMNTPKSDIHEEYLALLDAIRFGKTSDKSFRASLRGIGLRKVIDQASDVFIMIRTGHLHLYRDFGRAPFNDKKEFYLFDAEDPKHEEDGAQKMVRKYPWSEGTLFTFIIPLSTSSDYE
jgi:hypothetical protein